MRTSARTLTCALAIAALALPGCGGGGGEEEKSASTATSAQTTTQSAAAPQQPKPHQPKQQSTTKPPAAKPKPPSGRPPTDPGPLPNQGTKAVAPGVPTAKGGDNSIQHYGVEAEANERVEVAAIVKAYLEAQAAARWPEACSYLSAEIRHNLEALLERASKGSARVSCATAMATFFQRAPQAALHAAADIEVLSLRVQGADAFLIYRDGKGTPTEMHMVSEGGEWKVGALIGNTLQL